ncbi:MAG TPA: RAD55 family ATPase [Candidatus Dormibacteraeota bacterium]|nr:RAD55 family ATPase [Candidatus Dormibacteraeota bacterium]
METRNSERFAKASKTELIEKLIGSETKAELLMFFHENPETTDTVEGIAKRIHRNPKDIERDLEDLVDLGILNEVRTLSFNKTRDQELQREISKRLTSPSYSDDTEKGASREKTGVQIVDELLPEGYPSSSVVLVMGDPATGKTTLMIQLVVEALKAGKNIVYATLDDFPDSIRASMRTVGIDPGSYETEGRRRLTFIDCYSFLVGVRSKEQYSEDPQRLSDLSIVVSKALSETSDPSKTLLAMDSFTTLIQRSGVRPSFDFLHTLVAKIRSCKASCVTSLSRKAFHPAIIAAIQDKVDGVIEMKAEDTKDGLARYIRVSKMKSARHITAWTPYNRDPSLGLIVPSSSAVM